jgi:2-polyprenyl-6-methoxyphenol hydroxylase-like FAD-dependent oxidoreductase
LASARTVVIAGAGIGGLTAALTVARHGFRVVLLEQAERLEETGAGIQLSPNASRVLISLGLRERLAPHVAAPQELIVANARTGRVLARAPLGAAAEQRYGAPYWIIHRGDLQSALLEAVQAHPDIVLRLGTRVDDFATQGNGITVAAHSRHETVEERGGALIGADGLWSRLRGRLGHAETLRFAGHTAWRALVPAQAVACELSIPTINLWFGAGGHMVHYPVKGGRLINVVAIMRDDWREPGWSAPGDRAEILDRFRPPAWNDPPREILYAADRWLKWALFDATPLSHWGHGPVTLLGDAAHPILPYLAQGAAMAIEDAAELGQCIKGLGDASGDLAGALRRYEQRRLARTAKTQREAHRNGALYHMSGVAGFMRTLAVAALGGERLISRYDWLHGWTPTGHPRDQ